ncbi:MAG: S41 family peptidase [Candidatus Schekmanbacteria bacterium]|nr:S41 family peptidase [Candidatus Schekmanbacteria bacterium]
MRKSAIAVTLLALGLASLFVTSLAHRVYGSQAASPNVRAFSEVFAIVERQAFHDKSRKDLVEGSIYGMLRMLDPHTHYLDADTYSRMTAEQTGAFGGIGVSFDIRDGYPTVISPIEGTPAHAAGIRSGDRIVKINGAPTDGMSSSDVINKLRGQEGTSVTISILRIGWAEAKDITLVRDTIPLKSVPYAFMIRSGTGYVRVTNFSSTTAKELREAVEALAKKGMKHLLLDFRGNPGGLLNAAVEVSDLLLPEGRLIVYTRGRIPGSDLEFKASKASESRLRTDVPLVILTNGGTASASEIVAGAVQDWDRGLVVGTDTFGKGLVQRLYPVREGALQVTTAQYYTPSGRSIQRPYHARYRQAAAGEATPAEEIFYSNAGRQVKGGGGIHPDIEVEFESTLTPVTEKLEADQVFFKFAVQWTSAEDRSKLKEDFAVTEQIFQGFAEHMRSAGSALPAVLSEKDKDGIRRALKREIATVLWGPEAGFKVQVESQNQVVRALAAFPEAQALLELSKGTIRAKAKS